MKILLEDIMYERNLTVRQVSYITGLPKSTISDIANGKTIPRVDTLEKIAQGLKIKITDLIESPYL